MALTKIPVSLSATPSISDSGTSTAITIDSNGHVTLAGNLSVTGSTTTADNLVSADKNITLNYHASNDTSGSADGAGITIQDAVDASNNATMNWVAANDRFRFSHGLEINSGNVSIGHTSSIGQEVCQSGTTVSAWTPNVQINGAGNGGLAVSQWNTGNTASANLWLTKSSNGTTGTHAALSQDEAIGRIVFSASDGSTFSNGASIEAFADTGQGSNDTPARIEFKTTADGATTPTTRMTIKNDGKVGIGTTSPEAGLHVVGGIHLPNASSISFDQAAGNLRNAILVDSGDDMIIGDTNFDDIYFSTGQKTKTVVIKQTTGNVGIGTDSPSYKLDVGHANSGAIQARFKSHGDTGYTQGAITLETSVSTDSPASRGSGVYMFNEANDMTWYAGTLYGAANNFGISYKSGSTLQHVAASNINTGLALVITNSGNVGIGTTSPASLLHIKSTASDASASIILENTNNAQEMNIDYYNNAGAVQSRIGYSEGPAAFSFKPNVSATAAMYIDYNGKIGIGNTTPGTNHATANNLVVGSGAAGGMAVYNGTNLGWYAFSRDNANNTDAYDGGMSYNGDRQLKFHTNAGAVRMRIDGSGDGQFYGSWSLEDNKKLQMGGSADLQLWHDGSDSYIKDAGTGNLLIQYSDLYFGDGTNHDVVFRDTGHVLIGRTSAVNDTNGVGNPPLQIENATPGIHFYGTNTSNYAHSGGISFGSAESGGDPSWFYIYSHDENFHVYNNNGRCAYFPQGSTATWQYGSDERLKENIVDLNLGLNTVNSLKPRKFNWKEDGLEDVGFIAQEVKDHIPVAIAGTGESWVDGEDKAVKDAKTLKIANDKLIPVLVKAVQELSDKLEAAEARITTLEG